MRAELVVVALCVCCAVATSMSRRRLESIERNLERRLVERELARDERGLGDDYFRQQRELHQEQGTRTKRQEASAIEGCIQGDIVFVLDSSGSIGITNWQYVLQFLNKIIDRIGIGLQATRVGVLTYGNRAHIVFHLGNYSNPEDMKAAINQTKFLDENTNTSGGIRVAHKQMFTPEFGDRPMAPNMMIIMTDGVSTYDNDKTIPYAKDAKDAGIMVISLGVGDKTSQAELEGMASIGRNGQPLVYQVGGYDMLDDVREKLAHVACDVPEETEEPAKDPACETKEVECVGMPCKTKCQFGFAPDKNLCQTCQCLPEPPKCP